MNTFLLGTSTYTPPTDKQVVDQRMYNIMSQNEGGKQASSMHKISAMYWFKHCISLTYTTFPHIDWKTTLSLLIVVLGPTCSVCRIGVGKICWHNTCMSCDFKFVSSLWTHASSLTLHASTKGTMSLCIVDIHSFRSSARSTYGVWINFLFF